MQSAFGRWRIKPPPFDVRWAAGFLDGEGCIHVVPQTYRDTGRNTTYRLRLSLAQNNHEVLGHFLRGLGAQGRIYATGRNLGENRQMYTLVYDGKHALEVIVRLMPHLVRKRAEAEVACAFWVEGRCGLRPGRHGLPPQVQATRKRLYLKLRRLK